MLKKSIILYSICFTLSAGVAGAGAFILAPARTVSPTSDASQEINQNVGNAVNDDDEDNFGDDDFIPQELTPRDKFVGALADMKVLHGSANASIEVSDYKVDVAINDIYLTLASLSLDDIELSVDATITFMEKDFDIEATYAGGTIYLSMLDNDLKLETSDFGQITDMISSFGLPEIELPSEITSLNLNVVQEKLGEMPYEHTDEGYTFELSLFGDSPIIFKCDDDFNFTYVGVENLSLMGIKASLEANVEVAYEIARPVAIPETLDRKFTNFADILPLAKHIADLINQRQYAISINGSIIAEGETLGVSFEGATQFDLDTKTGAGCIRIEEHEYQDENGDNYVHNVALDISEEDVVFDYNSTIKGRLRYASLNDIIDLINSLMGDLDKELPTSLDGVTSMIEGTVLASVLNGHFEALLDNVIKDLKIRDTFISLTIDKSFLGLDGDIALVINFNKDKLIGVSLSNIKVLNRTIDVNLHLEEYDPSFSTGIDRNDMEMYADAANLVPLVKGITKIVEQRQFALGVEGSFKKEGQAKGLTFNGSTQFDLIEKTGDGVISITENESSYSKKPVHTVKVGVDDQDVRISYNNNLNAKFTIQTIKDIFAIVTDLMSDQNSRIYQWFGDKIDNMNETILMRVINGEFGLLFHNIIKEVELTDNYLGITVSGKIFNLENDIRVEIEFENENIKSVHLVNFEAIGYVVDLKVNLLEWNENYETLPLDNGSNYYNLSDIKTLAQLGLNVANMDYFHIKGTANIQMTAIVDISSIANLTDLPIEIEVFENNGDVCIKGTLKNIPTINNTAVLNIPVIGVAQDESHRSSLDFYYEGGYFYLTRHSYDRSGLIIHSWSTRTDYVKTDKADFVDNILGYLMGWGMRLNECSTIWDAINGAIEDHAERDEAMDYSSLLTNYAYTDESTSTYGKYKWDLGLNIAELANNDQLKYLNATIYGKDMEFTDPETNELVEGKYLSHLDASMYIKASVLTLDLSASLNLVDIDPFLTYEDFETSSLTAASYAEFRNYVNSHTALKPVHF